MLTACSALTLTSCGGEKQNVDRRTETGPTIAADVAEPLAERSERVAGLLERGDACGARAQVILLRRDLTDAINARTIPDIYLEDLSGVVNEIEAQLPPCEPMIPPPRKKQDEGKGKDKDKDKDEEGDD